MKIFMSENEIVDKRGSIYRVLPTPLLSSIGLGWKGLVVERYRLSYQWHAERYAKDMTESALTKTNWAPPTPENHMALAVLCIIGFIAYWVPTLAANSNRHRNRTAIGMLNLFLGWTLFGWLVALLWADTDNCEK
jgi:hypothetical protein